MADLCTMCGEKPATTTWGFPVCQSCADGLDGLHADLKEMERTDPALRALVERQDRDAWRADLKRRVAARRAATNEGNDNG
jgi:hypothetical protein